MKTAAYLAILAVVGMALNFLVQWYVIVFFGPGVQTDALFGAMVIPQFIVLLTSGPLGSTLVPLLSVADPSSRRVDGWTLFWGVTIIFGAMTVIFGFTAQWWVPALLPGLSGESRELAIELARIQVLGVVFSAQYAVVWAAGQARGWFVRTELALVFAFILSFVALFVAVKAMGIEGAAWVNAARPFLQAAVLLPSLGMVCRPKWKTPTLVEGWRRLRPLLLGSLYYKSDVLVDRYLSSLAPVGGLSLFFFARQLTNAGAGVLSKALVGPIVPGLARLAGDEKWGAFRRRVSSRLALVGAAIGACYCGLILVGRPFLTLLVGHGGVTASNLDLLYLLLLGLGGALIGALGQLLASSFYAFGDTRTPTKASMFGYTLGIGFRVGGFLWLGLFGLSLGITAYYFLNLGLLMWLLRKRLNEREFPSRV